MTDIELFQHGMNLLPRDARRGSRSISRISSQSLVRRSSVDAETDVTFAKTDSITAIAGTMLNDIARVAQAQAQYELLVPQASARLNMVADSHALDLMEHAAEHRRALRRY
jgi:hypothetical protein